MFFPRRRYSDPIVDHPARPAKYQHHDPDDSDFDDDDYRGQLVLSGPGNSIVTKIWDEGEDGTEARMCLTTKRLMESGKHWISYKLILGDKHKNDDQGGMFTYMGVVREFSDEGVDCNWDSSCTGREAYGGWWMQSSYGGGLSGNDEECKDLGFSVHDWMTDGQIISMELDMDAGTLRYW